MKKSLLFILLAVVFCSATAVAGIGGNISATRGFTPATNFYSLVTKSLTVNTTSLAAIRYLCTADCTYKLNGSGSSWLVKANTPETIYIPANVKSIVFSVTSSAGTGIYRQTF